MYKKIKREKEKEEERNQETIHPSLSTSIRVCGV
jgi:hypothetical protein